MPADAPVPRSIARALLVRLADERRGAAYFAPFAQALHARRQLSDLGLWTDADEQAVQALRGICFRQTGL